jgi:LPS O-antigen subunit length determinant protein (WzzB/FepE family)
VTQARKHEIAPVSGIPVLPSLPAPNAPVLTLRQAVEALFRGKWFILAVALIGIFAGTVVRPIAAQRIRESGQLPLPRGR